MKAKDIILHCRKHADLTQAELAFRAQTTPQSISKFENGAKPPSYDMVARLVTACGYRMAVIKDDKTFIDLDKLRQWRADRIGSGNCDFDDMEALGAFIERCEDE